MLKILLEIFTDLNPKKIIGLILIIIFMLLFFPFIDSKIIQPISLSRQIDNLDKLLNMDRDLINQDQQIKKIYDQILESMIGSNIELLAKDPIPVWKKFVFGGALGWLMILIIPFAKFNSIGSRVAGLILMIIIGAVLGWIGTLIPDFEMHEINLYLYPGLQFILLFVFVYLQSKKSKNK